MKIGSRKGAKARRREDFSHAGAWSMPRIDACRPFLAVGKSLLPQPPDRLHSQFFAPSRLCVNLFFPSSAE
jgi:hypothetical protein